MGQAEARGRRGERGVGEVGSSPALAPRERDRMTPAPDAIIIGAGPAGLACAATMRAAGLNVAVLEKADSVGAVWRRHYDRLHLHTHRNHSALPDMAMPPDYPTYPSRGQMVAAMPSDSISDRPSIRRWRAFDARMRNGALKPIGAWSRRPLWWLHRESPIRRIAHHGRTRRAIAVLSFTAASIATRRPIQECG
jgi:choline dehydrogenase-like flavoprotein